MIEPPTTTPNGANVAIGEGDVILVTEDHDGNRTGDLLLVEEIVRAEHPGNDLGEEYAIVNGARIVRGVALTRKTRLYCGKEEYAYKAPEWGQVAAHIQDTIRNGLGERVHIDTFTTQPAPSGLPYAGTSVAEVTFRHDSGHVVQAVVQIDGTVLPSEGHEKTLVPHRLTSAEAKERGLPGWKVRCNLCGTYGATWHPGLRPGFGALALCAEHSAELREENRRHAAAIARIARVCFE